MNPLPIDNFFRFLLSISPWSVLKIFVCFALLLYLVFASIVFKQVNLMTQTLHDQFEFPLKVVAAIHLAGVIFILFLALVIL